MNFKKIITATAASAAAVSMFALSASAVVLDKDLKTGWSVSTTVSGDEFADATTDSVFTLTFTVDESCAEKPGHDYWCVKPMINDAGWPFIDTLVGPQLSEGKDSYVITPGMTEIKFTIPAEELEHLQVAGMAFMGHGITLGELTFSDDDVLPAEPATTEEPVVTAPATGDVDAAAESSKGSPDTGVEDAAVFGGIALAAGAAIVFARKRK